MPGERLNIDKGLSQHTKTLLLPASLEDAWTKTLTSLDAQIELKEAGKSPVEKHAVLKRAGQVVLVSSARSPEHGLLITVSPYPGSGGYDLADEIASTLRANGCADLPTSATKYRGKCRLEIDGAKVLSPEE